MEDRPQSLGFLGGTVPQDYSGGIDSRCPRWKHLTHFPTENFATHDGQGYVF